jgi:hypothetical protein
MIRNVQEYQLGTTVSSHAYKDAGLGLIPSALYHFLSPPQSLATCFTDNRGSLFNALGPVLVSTIQVTSR